MKSTDIILKEFNSEYDDEAGMAQGNLYTISKAAQGLLDTIDDRDNLPEWVQEKIARVEDMLVTVWNYLQSQEAQGIDPQIDEDLKKWFKEKWVRFGPDGKIRGDCARGSSSEGKPKCLPQSKAHALGKKGRASAGARKRKQDPDANRRGAAKNVATKVKEDELDEACWKGYHKEGMKTMFGKKYPNCVKNTNEEQLDEKCWDTHRQVGMKNKGGRQVPNCVPKESAEACPHCGGELVNEEQMNEKQDACYRKVKSRYKVWPSAYASGALVQCRKKGAANWGNKSESIEEADLDEEWSAKYKSSINCSNPKGFSQKAHCASKNESQENRMDELGRIVQLSGAGPTEQEQEFDLIESIIDDLALRNGVDAEVIWEDLESLTDDELYVFAVTTEPVMEDWQKANKKDKTDGMSKKAVNAYRRENPGSKLKTAVTTKPSKLKKGSKSSKRRKSYCSRSKGQMNMHNISCAKTPDKAICKARRRWNC